MGQLVEMRDDEEDELLRSVALQNANTILLARRRAEEELINAKQALEQKTQELAHSLSVMHATLESTADGILVTSADGTVIGFNDKYLQMWNLPREAMQAADHRRLLETTGEHFPDCRQFIARIEAIYASSPPESFDLLLLADGRTFERFSKVQRIDAKEAGRVWSFRDITERRRAEDALRDETRILELLNKTGNTLVSTLDLPSLVQAVTDAATQLSTAQFGAFFYVTTDVAGDALTLGALSGAPAEIFEHLGSTGVAPIFHRVLNGEAAVRCDDALSDPRYGTSSQHGVPIGDLPVRSYLAVPVKSRSGEIIGGLFFGHAEPGVFTERTVRIVTGVAAQAAIAIDNARLYESAQKAGAEREKLLESERSARAEAERMGEIKDEFLATLSHELRTPLSAILGWAHILRRGTRDTAVLEQGLDTIERNARAQTHLIEDLLDMNRITSGKVRLDVQQVELVSIIEAALEAVRPAAEAKSIGLEKVLDGAVGTVAGDPSRLQQVVWNLLSNAIKFTPKDGKVCVGLQREGSHVEINVSDTGIGIRPEFLAHVFERFRQADASATRRYGGLGLGLSIVKQLVELHGGTVHATSSGEGQGATFIVQLPIPVLTRNIANEPRRDRQQAKVLPGEFKPLDLSGIKVLVVDDEADARDLIKRVLSECDAEVITAGTAAGALRLVESDKPHVLVSDIGMPDVDGYELLRRVRALDDGAGVRLPAIALTAFARSEDRTRALRAGFLVHVAKPVEPSELIATVASVVGRAGDK
jgi:signal transduction histidine kinase/PAS domain-containing protein/ActR/RegA family two-component response regulator